MAIRGGHAGIYGQRYSANGEVVGVEFQITDNAGNSRYDPSVTGLTDGGFVVAWQSYSSARTSSSIYGQIFDATGAADGTEFLMSTASDVYDKRPSLTGLADGRFVATWDSHPTGRGNTDIFSQLFEADGTPVRNNFRVNSYRPDEQIRSVVTDLADGGYVVTWDSRNQDFAGTQFGVFGQLFDDRGFTVGEEFQVNTRIINEQWRSDTAALSDGGFIVTWISQFPSSQLSQLVGQRYDATGAAVGGEFLIVSNSWTRYADQSVTGLLDGGFVVTWEGPGGLHGQRFDADGAVVGEVFDVTSNLRFYEVDPSITVLADGSFTIAWNGGPSSDYDAPTDIFARQFAAELWGTAGNNEIFDHIGANWVNGRDGDDTIRGLQGDDVLFGGAGDDLISGNAGDDEMHGQGGFDVMDGGAGNDIMFGNDGRDTMDGGTGRDTMNGDNGHDDMSGGDGADTMFGGAGNDRLQGNAGQDYLNGGVGDDRLYGRADNDTVIGNQGNDTLYGQDGNDRLFGNSGDDFLGGGLGDDLMNGGAGADVFVFAQGADRAMDFTDDVDTLRFDEALWGGTALTPSEILDFATVTGSDLVFEFGAGNTLTLVGYTDTSSLLDDITSF